MKKVTNDTCKGADPPVIYVCTVCGWQGTNAKLAIAWEGYRCPKCGSEFVQAKGAMDIIDELLTALDKTIFSMEAGLSCDDETRKIVCDWLERVCPTQKMVRRSIYSWADTPPERR